MPHGTLKACALILTFAALTSCGDDDDDNTGTGGSAGHAGSTSGGAAGRGGNAGSSSGGAAKGGSSAGGRSAGGSAGKGGAPDANGGTNPDNGGSENGGSGNAGGIGGSEPGSAGGSSLGGEGGTGGAAGGSGEDLGGAGSGGEAGGPVVVIPKTLSFESVPVPTTVADKQKVIATSHATVSGVAVDVAYHTEIRSGTVSGSNIFGRWTGSDGNPIKVSGADVISHYNDFSSLLPVGNKLFEVTHVESVPGGMYLSDVTQDSAGLLTLSNSRPIDFSAYGGVWDPCAGFVSPWGTHLGSEEYPSDARTYETATTVTDAVGGSSNIDMPRYWGLDPTTATISEVKAKYNPYNYGFITEVSVNASGAPTVSKHYAAGRRALELAHVMPDRKTVYLSDDGTNDAFYLFVAKTAGDLSEGKLYAAKWTQTSAAGAANGAATLEWIQLGPSAKDSEVRALIDGGTKFSDIFEYEAMASDGTCPNAASGFKPVNADSTGSTGNGRDCLKLKTGMELAASRLESRRYAGYLGATTEFRKTEGMTYDPATNRLFVAFSEINNGMLDNNATRDLGGPNHIKLKQNYCGAVYSMAFGTDAAIGSDYVAKSTSSLIEGKPLDPAGGSGTAYPETSPYYDATATGENGSSTKTNVCDVTGIANPDNITFIPGYKTLIIGEDSTTGHQNDALWAYNIETQELTRILTSPYGAEVTGAFWYPNLNGHAYLKVQLQHPYGESDPEKAPDAAAKSAYVGYIGPFPRMD